MNPLIVPGKLDSLTQIAQYVLAAAAAAELGKKAAYGLRLATDEIATNTIVHGYEESGGEGYLEVQVDLNDRNLTITIEDTAGVCPHCHDSTHVTETCLIFYTLCISKHLLRRLKIALNYLNRSIVLM